MEGLIPFVYRAIVRNRGGGQSSIGNMLFSESSPTASYRRLSSGGDSGRFLLSEFQLLPPSPRATTASAAPTTTNGGVTSQSPRWLTARLSSEFFTSTTSSVASSSLRPLSNEVSKQK